MRKLLFLAITLAILSCKTEEKPTYAILSGTIENTDSKEIKLYDSYNSNGSKEIALNNGKFTDTITIGKGHHYFIVENRNVVNFYAKEGDKIQLNYNAKKLDSTLTFDGDNKSINQYLSKKYKAIDNIKLANKDLYSKKEGEFKEHILKVKQAQDDFLYNFSGLPESYISKEKANINYAYLISLFIYESYHSYYAKKENFVASDTIKAPLKDINYKNLEDYIFSDSYRGLVERNYSEKAQELTKKDSTLTYDIAYFKTIADIESDEIRNSLAYNSAKYGITYTENLEEYYKWYTQISTNENNNKKIEEDYKKLKTLAKGSPSPKFVDYENNAGGTTSLSDLKGKYVYIDVWATWCGPCIAEIPSLKKLEKEYHDKNITFVSISIDDKKDHEKWKKMIVDRDLGGVQLFADNNWQSQFIKDYMIKGIPRFIILDPEGNIVTPNAARPSDKKLIPFLEDLNI